jgi:hypothetical protein
VTKAKKHELNGTTLAEYFSLGNVLDGLATVCEQVFGVKVTDYSFLSSCAYAQQLLSLLLFSMPLSLLLSLSLSRSLSRHTLTSSLTLPHT